VAASSTVRARRDFDALSAVYDETRRPLDEETVEKLIAFVNQHRWNSVLEVGVGTGRIAGPLVARGVRVVGIDASRGMLTYAVRKGLPHLVRGAAHHLPFPDRTFDVSLFVHVLHILDDVTGALREAARVARHGVLAIMDPAPDVASADGLREETPRDVVRKVLVDAGYPDLLRSGPRPKEREILRAHPPTETLLLSDRVVTEPAANVLDTIAKRAYRHVLDVPPEVLDRAVRVARDRVGDRMVTYHRRETLVWWADPGTDGEPPFVGHAGR
jgi:SAM-dependent methyltransferase